MTDVGSARVEVEGDVRNFARQTEQDLNRALAKVKPDKVLVEVDTDAAQRSGEEAGEALGDGVTRGADGRLRNSHGKFVKMGDDAGKKVGDGISAGAKKSIEGNKGSFLSTLKKAFTPDQNLFAALRAPFTAALSTPAVGAVIAVAGTAALAFVGAFAATLATAGLGAVFLGIGAAALFGSRKSRAEAEKDLDKAEERVRKAEQRAQSGTAASKRSLADAMAQLAKAQAAVEDNAAFVKLDSSLNKLGQTLKNVGKSAAAPLIGPFTRAIDSLAEKALGLTPLLHGIFSGLAPAIQPLTDGMAGFVEEFLKVINQDPATIQAMRDALIALGGNLPRIGKALGELFALLASNENNVRNMGFLFNFVSAAIDNLGRLLMVLSTILDGVIVGWNAVKTAVSAAIGWITGTAVPALVSAWSTVKTAAAAVADWFTGTVAPALSAAWNVIKSAAESVAAWYQANLAPLFNAIGALLVAMFQRISLNAQLLWTGLRPIFLLIGAAWLALWTVIKTVWEVIGPPIFTAITGWLSVLKAIWTATWSILKSVLSTTWTVIKTVVSTALAVITGVIKTATALIKGDWRGAWEAIKGIVSSVGNGIKTIVTALINNVRSVISAGINAVKSIWTAGWNTFSGIVSGVVGRVRSAVNSVRNAVIGVFSNAGSWLLSAGRRIIDGLISGIRAGFGRVQGLLSSLTAMLPDWKGPASVDSKILEESGRMVMGGFEDGLESQFASVRKRLGDLTNDLPSFTTDAAAARGGDGASAANPGGQVSLTIQAGAIVIQGQGAQAGEEAAEAVLEKLAQAVLAG